MRNRCLYITLLSILGFSHDAMAQAVAQPPRLVVAISIDQLRTDYLETFSPVYSAGGLKRMLDEGKVYTNASYNFTPVDHASAVAAIMTGTGPYYNGIVGKEWLSRNTLRTKSILLDDGTQQSPRQLATSTLGDELKIATNGAGFVFAFAPTAESAILSAGHAADGAAWISQGRWGTTDYYTPANLWLTNYTRFYPPVLDANRNITEIALKCIELSALGIDDNTDLVSVTYQAGSDMQSYAMLDRTIAHLIEGISQRLSLDRVLFVLTSTGSGEEEKEDRELEKYRIPSGKFYISRTANLLNMYLGAIYGAGRYVEATYGNQLFLNRKLTERQNINTSEMLKRAQDFILQLSGVRNVYTASQLLTSDSPKLERVRNGFNVEKSGDIIIDIAPGWQLVNEDTQQTSFSHAGYIPFPIIFFGAGIQSQRIQLPVTTDHIAPTIARAIRIRAPNACSTEPLF